MGHPESRLSRNADMSLPPLGLIQRALYYGKRLDGRQTRAATSSHSSV
jgi:hypothetical protein